MASHTAVHALFLHRQAQLIYKFIHSPSLDAMHALFLHRRGLNYKALLDAGSLTIYVLPESLGVVAVDDLG